MIIFRFVFLQKVALRISCQVALPCCLLHFGIVVEFSFCYFRSVVLWQFLYGLGHSLQMTAIMSSPLLVPSCSSCKPIWQCFSCFVWMFPAWPRVLSTCRTGPGVPKDLWYRFSVECLFSYFPETVNAGCISAPHYCPTFGLLMRCFHTGFVYWWSVC